METKITKHEPAHNNARAYYISQQSLHVLDITEEHTMTRVSLLHILYMKCNGYLTTLHLTNGDTITSSYHLKLYEEKVADMGFLRINHNLLVNSVHIDGIRRLPENKCVVIVKNEALSVSKRRRNVLNLASPPAHLSDEIAHLSETTAHLSDETAHP